MTVLSNIMASLYANSAIKYLDEHPKYARLEIKVILSHITSNKGGSIGNSCVVVSSVLALNILVFTENP